MSNEESLKRAASAARTDLTRGLPFIEGNQFVFEQQKKSIKRLTEELGDQDEFGRIWEGWRTTEFYLTLPSFDEIMAINHA